MELTFAPVAGVELLEGFEFVVHRFPLTKSTKDTKAACLEKLCALCDLRARSIHFRELCFHLLKVGQRARVFVAF